MSNGIDLMEPVTGREFGRMLGVSEAAVRKAYNRGSIKKGRDFRGQYIPLVAAREWGKEILQDYWPTEKAKKTEPKKKAAPVKSKPPVKLKPVVPKTAEEFVDEDDDENEDPENDIESGPLTDDSPKHEAERRTAIFKARTAELLYQEKKGEMIPRSKMRVLYEYGSQIRSSFEALPDRVIDDILAVAEDRQAAKRILVEAIHGTLTGLSDPEKLNL